MSLQIKLLRKTKNRCNESCGKVVDGQRKDSSGSTQKGHNCTNQKAEMEIMTVGGTEE